MQAGSQKGRPPIRRRQFRPEGRRPEPPNRRRRRSRRRNPANGAATGAPDGALAAAAARISYPYSIKLDAFRTVADARKAVAGYDKKGIKAYWVKANLGSRGTWYRIFSGQYQTEQEAAAAAAKLGLQKAVVKLTKYSTLIGAFPSPEDIGREIQSLSDGGFCPYVIREGERELCTSERFTPAKGLWRSRPNWRPAEFKAVLSGASDERHGASACILSIGD